jgi:hypothetical protein
MIRASSITTMVVNIRGELRTLKSQTGGAFNARRYPISATVTTLCGAGLALNPTAKRFLASRLQTVSTSEEPSRWYAVPVARLPPPLVHGPDHRGEPRPDRRVLLHPRWARCGAQAAAAAGRDLILAAALVSILLSPLLFFALDRWQARLGANRVDIWSVVFPRRFTFGNPRFFPSFEVRLMRFSATSTCWSCQP